MTDRSDAAAGVAVVTGGGSGFGRALGERCASRGFSIALLDLDGTRAADEATAIARRHGVKAIGRRTDVGDADDVEASAAAVAEALGGADLVFSNVGVQQIGAVDGFSDEAWRWMLDVNVVGTARVARSYLPLLRRSDRAHFVVTASSSVLVPATRLAAYQASKFAVLGLAETLRLEWADDGIAVSVLFPSGMTTRHLESSLAARPGSVAEAIVTEGDIEAMMASNPGFARDVTSPEVAAAHAVDDVLDGESYIVTHGDLVEPLVEQQRHLRRAAELARERSGPA